MVAEGNTYKAVAAGTKVTAGWRPDGRGYIIFPPLGELVDRPIDEVGKQNDGAAGRMCDAVAEWQQDSGIVDLAGGNSLRISWSAAVFTNRGPLFIRYDDDHKTRPNCLSPACGFWSEGPPISSALRELGEEAIIRRDNEIGLWDWVGQTQSVEWVSEYANDHQMSVNPRLNLDIRGHLEVAQSPYAVSFHFGGDIEFWGLVAFEPETGGVEGMIPFRANIPDDIEIVDGEWCDGRWLNREVHFGNPSSCPMTSKASVIMEVDRYLQSLHQ